MIIITDEKRKKATEHMEADKRPSVKERLREKQKHVENQPPPPEKKPKSKVQELS